MKKLAILFIGYLLMTSCNNENKYRNQNHIWFVAIGETEGEWVEIDHSGNSPLLVGGSCTKYYKSGNIRETYTLDFEGEYDTIFYYDTSEALTHYSINENEIVQNYFYTEGDFKAYNFSGDIIMSGNVKNNQLTNPLFFGNVKTFIDLYKPQGKVKNSIDTLFRDMLIQIKNNQKNKRLMLSDSILSKLESIRLDYIVQVDSSLLSLKNMKVDKEMQQLKNLCIESIEIAKGILESEISLILEIETSYKNNNAIIELFQKIIAKRVNIIDKLAKHSVDVVRKNQFGDYLAPYF